MRAYQSPVGATGITAPVPPPQDLPVVPPPQGPVIITVASSDAAPPKSALAPGGAKGPHVLVRPNGTPAQTTRPEDAAAAAPILPILPEPTQASRAIQPLLAPASPEPATMTTDTANRPPGAILSAVPIHVTREYSTSPDPIQQQSDNHLDFGASLPQTPSEIPNKTTTAPLTSPTPATPARPAEQLVPVLVSIANRPGDIQHMTLQLQPDALGHLLIQIDRAPNTPMQIRIAAERPETLVLLQRDTPQLQHALDQAGIPRDTMALSFHTSQAIAPAPSASDTDQASPQLFSTNQSHQGFGEGRQQRAALHYFEAGEDPGIPVAKIHRSIQIRSGVDITA